MKAYCKYCDINWADLHRCISGYDEEGEFCPLCRNDHNLEDPKEGPSYIMCPFTAKIIDVDTKQELDRIPKREYRPVNEKPALTETKQAIADRELRAIEAYHASGKEEDYFKAFKS